MNVLVIVAEGYPDMREVTKRLKAASDAGKHTTVIRKYDHHLSAILTGLGADFVKYEQPEKLWDHLRTGDAYNEGAANFADKIVVYHDKNSGPTSYFVKRASRLACDKTEIIEKGKRVAIKPWKATAR